VTVMHEEKAVGFSL